MRGLLLAALIAPTVAFAQEAPGVLEGVVFEAGTGRPLPGVEVVVDGQRVVTGPGGAFVLSLPAGSHEVVVSRDGVTRPTTPVVVGAGRRTELLITWDADRAVLPAQVEQPDSVAAVGQTEQVDGPVGRVEGRVVSSEGGTPVAGARVYVRGRAVEAVTGADGRFVLEVPEGTWELSIIASAYAAQAVPDVAVVADAATPVAVELVPAGVSLEDFTVRAPAVTGGTAALLDERKEGTAVADVIGAEQMSQSGDSTAAAALRRVTGLTVVGGKFIYVRGLGERYSTTLLNGGQLPSPEPERRVVPLDMFPAAVLDSVVIQKTFSPDMPAEFGGGVVQLRTRAFPSEPVIKLQLSGGWTYRTTFAQGLRYQGGPTDFLGIDGGTRALPADVAAASSESPLKEKGRFSTQGYTPEELQALGLQMPQVWTPTDTMIGPDKGLSLALGNGWRPGGRPVGALLALAYDDSWLTQDFRRVYYQTEGGTVVPDADYTFHQTTRRVRLSGLLSLGVKPADGHEISTMTTVLRNTEDEARTFSGFLPEESYDIAVTRLRWIERMLLVQQILGKHDLGTGDHPVHLDWRYGFAQATRLEPDRRQTRYDEDTATGTFALSRRDGDSNSRFYSTLLDRTHDAGLDVTIPIGVPGRDDDAKIKVGGAFVRKDREVDTRRFSFVNKGDKGDPVMVQTPEVIFAPDNIRPDFFQIKEITQTTDNYFARQTVAGGYAMTEVPAMPWLDVMAGARVEFSRQDVTTFELFNPSAEPVVSTLANVDLLPAATLTFIPREDMRVRLGYGRTVSRPEFRELSPAVFQDVVGGRASFGNPDLQRAIIDNVDARWEWFLSRGDVVSVGGFYKRFTSPIETLVIIGADPALTYANALYADNFGLEVEARKDFSFVHASLRDLYVSANASFIRSQITLDAEQGGVQTNNERALQGQSPWVVNALIGYDNPELGINAALLYNAFGPRISEVGSFGLPDALEMPFHTLDFVFNAELGKGFTAGVQVKNMLDQQIRYRLTTGEVIEERKPGPSIKVNLGWSY
ncbi:MAG: TonB-dependent receptor [Alphaproteobacteria bacterium]|nr:TonB-dependent receptor [Alphaproteobacteria bacterium]